MGRRGLARPVDTSLVVDRLSPFSSQDLREKNWKAMEALASAERGCEEKLRSLTQAKVSVGLGLASV